MRQHLPCEARNRCLAAVLTFALALVSTAAQADGDITELKRRVEAIEANSPVALGVYAKNLGTGDQLQYKSERSWYLASLVKVPLAIAILQAVENHQLALDDKITLQESDYVDGAGDLLFHKPGARFTIGELLQHSLENSDSTATDMLMRSLGVDAFNKRVQTMVDGGLAPMTTIVQVRFDAYQELHPTATTLSNTDYVEIRSAGDYEARVDAFRRKLGLSREQLRVNRLEEAFARYYQSGLNSGTLEALGEMLERLARGELLNAAHTGRILEYMQRITTGDNRLRAGLPSGTPFAQKTGTQIERACNMGITHPHARKQAMIIVMCTEGDIEEAEEVFAQVAAAISQSTLYRQPKDEGA